MVSGIVILVALAAGGGETRAADITGAGWAINGDTLIIEQQRVRLFGIDALRAGSDTRRAVCATIAPIRQGHADEFDTRQGRQMPSGELRCRRKIPRHLLRRYA
jgi:hypothetical protein